MSRGPTYNSQKIWQSEKKCIENVKKRGRLELQSRNLMLIKRRCEETI